MSTRVVLATHNVHKIPELRKILGPALGEIELVAYDGPEPVEDGSTFAANALLKARAAFLHSGVPALADDSGICVDALDGAPGVISARFAGTRVDADNTALLLEKLADAPDRSAQFVCAAAFVWAGGEIVEEGVWPGTVLREPAGTGGFGYDPVFAPAGSTRSSAQLSAEEKNAVSHRARAFTALMPRVHAALRG